VLQHPVVQYQQPAHSESQDKRNSMELTASVLQHLVVQYQQPGHSKSQDKHNSMESTADTTTLHLLWLYSINVYKTFLFQKSFPQLLLWQFVSIVHTVLHSRGLWNSFAILAMLTNSDWHWQGCLSIKDKCVYLINACMTFGSCDLDPITLTYELDLDILNMYLCTKNAISRSTFQKLETE